MAGYYRVLNEFTPNRMLFVCTCVRDEDGRTKRERERTTVESEKCQQRVIFRAPHLNEYRMYYVVCIRNHILNEATICRRHDVCRWRNRKIARQNYTT